MLKKVMRRKGAYIYPEYTEVPENISFNKGKKLTDVNNILVNVIINDIEYIFQGNEDSQNRLNRRITILREFGGTCLWRDIENNAVEIGLDDALIILKRSIEEQDKLWIQDVIN